MIHEGLHLRLGEVDRRALTATQFAAAKARAERDLAVMDVIEQERVHREQLQEDIGSVLSPYEHALRVIAEQVEVRRIARLKNKAKENDSQRGVLRGLHARRQENQIMADGEYTEKWFLTAEDEKTYPFKITYRAEGKGSVGEGERIVTPITYTQLLESRGDFPIKREPRGNDIEIELKDGEIDCVSLIVFREMWENQETDLLARDGTESVKSILDTGFVTPKPEVAKEDALKVSLWFESLRGQQEGKQGEEQQDPHLTIRHAVDYGWEPKKFEYDFFPRNNHFRRRNDGRLRRDTYETDRFTSLLQSTLRIIPANPIQL